MPRIRVTLRYKRPRLAWFDFQISRGVPFSSSDRVAEESSPPPSAVTIRARSGRQGAVITSYSIHYTKLYEGNAQLAQRVGAYGIEAQAVDGMNVVAVLSAAQAVV